MTHELPEAKTVVVNPSQAQMREWALEHMPRVTRTEFDNLNYDSEVTARLKRSTFFVADQEIHQQRIPRAEAEEWARRQDAYVAGRHMILVEGNIGAEAPVRTGARLYIERTQANIPAMQQQLYFPRDGDGEPQLTVVYTPGLTAPGMPDERLITVDLDAGVTRVFGSDYFGESKMGGLRMWNHLVYDQRGLALHAGCKVFPDVDGREKLALVVGLSGTGKTTTTFRQQLGSLPVQDDFVALMPGGTVHASECGCFAKTYGLDADDEPIIYQGVARHDAWLENVWVDADTGAVDFLNDSHTRNGRATFPLANIPHRRPLALPTADFLLILNRNDSIIPAVARLRREQAASYFMLGETRGTSAGGSAEAGKNLRVPGTNPFFFHNDAWQANRLLELLDTMPDLQVFLMNTGRVGGGPGDERSQKIRIPHSSAIIEGIVRGTIDWDEDRDFGYAVALDVPGVDDAELLRPRLLYERQARSDEYRDEVERLKAERTAFLERFEDLDERVLKALR